MSHSTARAIALILLHQAAQAIVAAERELRAAKAITPGDSISHELTAAALQVSNAVQHVSGRPAPADKRDGLQFR